MRQKSVSLPPKARELASLIWGPGQLKFIPTRYSAGWPTVLLITLKTFLTISKTTLDFLSGANISSLKVILCLLQWGSLSIGTHILSLNLKTGHDHFMYWGGKPVPVGILLFLHLSLLLFPPIFTSSATISFVLCHHFKVILLVRILP